MELASTECRKSLDQLLEQALAERSREDDQVEVTYELTDDCSREHRGVRLKPENATSSNNSQNKEDEDEEEETVGSVQMERKVRKNTVILSVYIILCLSGFSSLQSLQSSTYADTGLQALSLLYFIATLSCFCAPIIEQKVGLIWTTVVVSILEIIYLLVFHFYHPAILLSAAFLLGLGLGPMIHAQTSYLSRNISRLSYMTQVMRNKIQQRFLRTFFVLSKTYYFTGHLVATVIMEYTSDTNFTPSSSNQSTVAPVTTIRHTELCYQRLCKNGIYPQDLDPEDVIPSVNVLPTNTTRLFLCTFTVFIVVGVIVVFFLEKIEVLLEQDPMERSLIYQSMRQIRLILVDKNVRLAVPILIFIGIEQAFIFGDFTRAYINCALGTESVGFTMMCLGGAHTLGSIGVHLFSQHFQRPIIMAGGLVCQSGLLMVLWLWTPVKDDAAVFYVIAGGWGLCNAIWETLTITFLTSTYVDDWQVPICTSYQLQWFGMGVTFLINPYFCAEIKILILAIFLAVAIVPYTILEFRLHHRQHIQNRTDML